MPVNLTTTAAAACTVQWQTAPVAFEQGFSRAQFIQWQDGSTDNPRTIIAPSTAVQVYYIGTVADYFSPGTQVNPPAGGSIVFSPPSPDGFFQRGVTVQLTAVPAPGFIFGGWTNAFDGYVPSSVPRGMANQQNVVINNAQKFIANFYSTGCTFTVPPVVLVAGAGGTGSFDVTSSAPECQWFASMYTDISPGLSKLTLNTASGAGNGKVQYTWVGSEPKMSAITQVYVANTSTYAVQPNSPTTLGMQPSSLTGTRNTFTVSSYVWSPAAHTIYVLIQPGLYAANGCYLEYKAATNQYRLLNDAGTLWGASTALSTPRSNSACTVYGITPGNQNNIFTLTLDVGLAGTFLGTKRIHMNVYDTKSTYTSGWNVVGSWSPSADGTPVARYRLYNPFERNHFYTTDANEYNFLASHGYFGEGTSYRVLSGPGNYNGASSAPYFRLFNYVASYRSHYWTADSADFFQQMAFNYSGSGYTKVVHSEMIDGFLLTTPVTGAVPLYRLFHSAAGIYFWTENEYEKNVLAGYGWSNPVVDGYVIPQSGPGPVAAPVIVLSDASFSALPIAPGQRIRISGRNVSGTQVRINGAPAQIVDTPGDDLIAIVPDHLTAGQAKVEVDGAGEVTLPVAALSPAVYTAGPFGKGAAASAPPGGVATIQLTGIQPGAQDVAVYVGGRSVPLLSLQPVETGKVALSFTVPEQLDSGGEVSLSVRIGASYSQTGVTLRIE